ncbi:MAG: tetratricopeptide repeat protein [Rhodocyclales bacterium]|nr:tetratricopeptide repeat protein [Rhodocyclales bacterium]
MKPLQIEGARALGEAGAVNHVRVVASADGLYVEVNKTFTVANRMKQTRYFAKADTCFSWLREMGISRINEVDLAQWDADERKPMAGLAGILAAYKAGVSALIGSEWARLTNKVETLSAKGRHAEAIIVANQALQLAEESLEPDHPDRAFLLNSLATEHYAKEQFDTAEPLYRRALEIAEKAHGPDDPFVGVCLNNLAEACDALGRSDETEPLYLRALAIWEKDTDLHKDQAVPATILTNLAALYTKQGTYVQAEQLCKRALEIWDDISGILGPKDPDSAWTLEVLADLYRQTDRKDQAVPLERRLAKLAGKRK